MGRSTILAGRRIGRCGVYAWLATSTIDHFKLLSLVFIVVILYVMIFASAQALMTGVAQAHGMTGRLSAVYGFAFFIPAVLAALAGGWLVAHVSVRGTFLIAAGVTLVIALPARRAIRLVTPEQTRVNTRNADGERGCREQTIRSEAKCRYPRRQDTAP